MPDLLDWNRRRSRRREIGVDGWRERLGSGAHWKWSRRAPAGGPGWVVMRGLEGATIVLQGETTHEARVCAIEWRSCGCRSGRLLQRLLRTLPIRPKFHLGAAARGTTWLGVSGPRLGVGTRRDVLGVMGLFCMVEETRLIRYGRGRVGVAAPMESKMAKHVVGCCGVRRPGASRHSAFACSYLLCGTQLPACDCRAPRAPRTGSVARGGRGRGSFGQGRPDHGQTAAGACSVCDKGVVKLDHVLVATIASSQMGLRTRRCIRFWRKRMVVIRTRRRGRGEGGRLVSS